MKDILVTTDLSANSRSAIRFALQLASKTGANLIFYHVIEVMKPTAWSDARFANFEAGKKEEFLKKLRKFVAATAIGPNHLPGDASYIAEIGTDVTAMTIAAATKRKAGFICMSTRGAGNVKKIFGTNASAMIMHSRVPLVIVPDNYKPTRISKLFYASDLARLAVEIKVVKELAMQVGAEATVYHYDYLLNVTQDTSVFERRVERYQGSGFQFNFKRQDIDKSLSELLRKDIKSEKASAVVLFTKQNRNWFDRLFAPSEAARISFNANVPLFIFRKKS
jgi:nucleotide-binding universal stress UspA family protein